MENVIIKQMISGDNCNDNRGRNLAEMVFKSKPSPLEYVGVYWAPHLALAKLYHISILYQLPFGARWKRICWYTSKQHSD